MIGSGLDHVLCADAVPPAPCAGAVDQSTFTMMPGYLADGQALRRSHNRLFAIKNGDASEIASIVRHHTGYPVVEPIHHLRLLNTDCSRLGLVVLHNESATGDVEMIVYATPGLPWSRPALAGVARWIFDQLDFRRVTLRIRGDDARARDYARRLGFRAEGTQRRWFANDQDCQLWGMLRSECVWLRR